MTDLSDAALGHLRAIVDPPGLGATRYDIAEEIGRGGMGVVYLARDRVLERSVAIKVVHAHAFGGGSTERLRNEARILARLEHPGIVPVYDAGVLSDGRAFYAMKHVAGRRLDQFAHEGHDVTELLRVFGRICEAVGSAHAQGVLHRDLKPENIRVGAFGEVLVLDFGVAKLLGASVGESRTPGNDGLETAGHGEPTRSLRPTTRGTVIGTPGYMAPEQARGEVDELDVRADVYALGAILHFLCVGIAPVQPVRTDETLAAEPWHLAAHVVGTRPSTFGIRRVPVALEAIARKALAADKRDRYASVPALLDDVHRYSADRPVTAFRESLPRRIVRVAARYKTPIVLVLAYLAMRCALLFFRST